MVLLFFAPAASFTSPVSSRVVCVCVEKKMEGGKFYLVLSHFIFYSEKQLNY
jgi:hypothetical protein